MGTHTITATASGISKSVDTQVTPYVKIDPAIGNVVNLNPTILNPTKGFTTTIGIFDISEADEPFKLAQILFESDISNPDIFFISGNPLGIYFAGAANANLSSGEYQIQVRNADNYLGSHTLTIKEIQAIGIRSGLNRLVSGLPVTFTFSISQ